MQPQAVLRTTANRVPIGVLTNGEFKQIVLRFLPGDVDEQ